MKKNYAVLMYEIHNRLQYLEFFETEKAANETYKYLKKRYDGWRVQLKQLNNQTEKQNINYKGECKNGKIEMAL